MQTEQDAALLAHMAVPSEIDCQAGQSQSAHFPARLMNAKVRDGAPDLLNVTIRCALHHTRPWT